MAPTKAQLMAVQIRLESKLEYIVGGVLSARIITWKFS